MNIQRITISIPNEIYTLLTRQVVSGNISQYISETIHRRLIEETVKKKLHGDAITEFLKLRKVTNKRPTKRILTAIHKGRKNGA